MDYIFHIIATITSVFIGATAAFFWERLTRRKEREKELVAAGNRAIFIISRQFSVLNQLKAQIIDPVRNDPDAWVKMSAVLPRSHEDLRFDIGSLQFLLDSESPNILNELLVEEDRFFEAMKTINERSHKHYNELQPRMAGHGQHCELCDPVRGQLTVGPTSSRDKSHQQEPDRTRHKEAGLGLEHHLQPFLVDKGNGLWVRDLVVVDRAISSGQRNQDARRRNDRVGGAKITAGGQAKHERAKARQHRTRSPSTIPGVRNPHKRGKRKRGGSLPMKKENTECQKPPPPLNEPIDDGAIELESGGVLASTRPAPLSFSPLASRRWARAQLSVRRTDVLGPPNRLPSELFPNARVLV